MDNYNITIDKEDKKMILNAQTPIFFGSGTWCYGVQCMWELDICVCNDYYWFHHHLLATFTFLQNTLERSFDFVS
jgi:hypothetical protein